MPLVREYQIEDDREANLLEAGVRWQATPLTMVSAGVDNPAAHSRVEPSRLWSGDDPLRRSRQSMMSKPRLRLRSIALLFAPSCFHSADSAEAERAASGSSHPVSV